MSRHFMYTGNADRPSVCSELILGSTFREGPSQPWFVHWRLREATSTPILFTKLWKPTGYSHFMSRDWAKIDLFESIHHPGYVEHHWASSQELLTLLTLYFSSMPLRCLSSFCLPHILGPPRGCLECHQPVRLHWRKSSLSTLKKTRLGELEAT